MRALDVRRLQREGALSPGRTLGLTWSRGNNVLASIQITAETDRVVLQYRIRKNDDDWKDVEYGVDLDRTACHLGGERMWWLCPAVGCARRVAVLYLSEFFACRHCLQLAYQSQRDSPFTRAALRANVIRRRLRWEEGILNPPLGRPKGMHLATYERLRERHDVLAHHSLVGIAGQTGLLTRLLRR